MRFMRANPREDECMIIPSSVSLRYESEFLSPSWKMKLSFAKKCK